MRDGPERRGKKVSSAQRDALNESAKLVKETHESSRSSTQKEQPADPILLSSFVELGHLGSSSILRSGSVDSADLELLVFGRPILDDVEHGGELREEKDLIEDENQNKSQQTDAQESRKKRGPTL